MLVSGSNRFSLNPNEKETLVFMERNGPLVVDIEEGEISDETTSVEEISEEDFKQEAQVVSKPKPKRDPRVWMEDVLKYSVSSNYASGLQNYAWAQAVQNKPLDESLVRDFGSDGKSKLHESSLLVDNKEDNSNTSLFSKKEVCSIVIDDSSEEIDSRMEGADGDEKEEGELEEGEIELDSQIVEKVEEGNTVDNSDRDPQVREFEMKIKSIREALENATVKHSDKSYNEVCSGLLMALESLQIMILDKCIPVIDALIQQSFTGIQAVYSMFHSITPKQQEQDKDILLRLLAFVKDQYYALFSSEHLNEIEVMIRCLESHSVSSSAKAIDTEKEICAISGMKLNGLGILGESPGHRFNSAEKFNLEPVSIDFMDQNDSNMESKTLNSKGSGGFGPLNLHSDHDGDSFHSLTQDTLQLLPNQKSVVVGDGEVGPDFGTNTIADKTKDAMVQPYETDALKAVSTYQQRFSRSSFFLSNQLPSPTPSEEYDDGDGDSSGEVSSSSTAGTIKTENPSVPVQPVKYATPNVDSSSGQGLIPTKIAVELASDLNNILKATRKNRDPRLKFADLEVGALDFNQHILSVPKSEPVVGIMRSRKHKVVEESVLDLHTLKRQRNGLKSSEVSKDVQMASRNGRWLESGCTVWPQHTDKTCSVEDVGTDFRKSENGEICSGKIEDSTSGNLNVSSSGNQQLPVSGIGNMVSFHSLSKDIATNPTNLMHLIMDQQKLAADAQKKPAETVQSAALPSISSVIMGTVPLANDASSNSAEIDKKSARKSQIPAQTIPMDFRAEFAKIRMKPRDPRRILHSNTFKQNGFLATEQFKANGVPSSIVQGSKDNLNVRQQSEQPLFYSLPSQSASTPDIARQFTKLMENLPETVSDSRSATSLTAVNQTVSSQPIPVKTDKLDVTVVGTNSNNRKSVTDLSPQEGAMGSFQSQNAWEDVEHLFEGFDDKQKAAIQRERARRKEEQNKLFSAQKLCLVLDLDHTLLNSAKFVEVDPVHEMILRKKEEQDCQKPQRHLFRFPHMGMWTKLRPGIWNFLEKASKLYELHLYTMGNKLYATEMAKVLDPTGSLFAGRVISRGDDGDPLDGEERVPKIKDLDGVLGMESAVVIIDDSVRVWPHNKLNLIAVERYIYFPCSRRHFGLPGPALLEIDHDERPEDGALASSLAVIERIHQNFFSHQSLNDADVRNILASEQKKILAGCCIVFSRVFPVGEAKPHLHPLWQTAEQFGAVCTNQIDEHVTHVVANSLGTDKVNWALSTGRFVVHPCWVEASALLYRRANERDFAIKL